MHNYSIHCRPMFTGKNQTGFTLMEMIAVMAIIAILAGSLAPNIFDAIKRARADVEIENLSSISESIEYSILKQKIIPTSTTSSWVAAAMSTSSFSASDIEFNAMTFRRRLVFDPRFFTTTDAVFPGLTQNQGLASAPNSPRAMLISDMTRHVPSVTNSSAVFNAIWDQTNAASLVENADLKIQRFNFASKFHRIILSNQHSNQPYYRLETGTVTAIPAAAGGVDGSVTRYVLRDTKLSLFSDPFPIGGKELDRIVKSEWSIRYQTDGLSWNWNN